MMLVYTLILYETLILSYKRFRVRAYSLQLLIDVVCPSDSQPIHNSTKPQPVNWLS